MRLFTAALIAICSTALAGCNSSNNLLLGEVRATLGTHNVTVTDCYRFRVDPPRRTTGGFEYLPCRDAHIEIRDERLTVNGKTYGGLHLTDEVMVDHGTVLINGKRAGS